MNVDIFDSWADAVEVKHEYGVDLISEPEVGAYDAIILAVDHSDFKSWGEEKIRCLGKENHVLYDIKHVLNKDESDLRL